MEKMNELLLEIYHSLYKRNVLLKEEYEELVLKTIEGECK